MIFDKYLRGLFPTTVSVIGMTFFQREANDSNLTETDVNHNT